MDALAIERVELDTAVQQLADAFRAALEQPARATAALDVHTLRTRFEESLPAQGMPAADVLKELIEKSEGGLAGGTGGRYFGYVTGGALPSSACGRSVPPPSSSSR
jgi:hypothetical protein